jgi:hypothetical protein
MSSYLERGDVSFEYYYEEQGLKIGSDANCPQGCASGWDREVCSVTSFALFSKGSRLNNIRPRVFTRNEADND